MSGDTWTGGWTNKCSSLKEGSHLRRTLTFQSFDTLRQSYYSSISFSPSSNNSNGNNSSMLRLGAPREGTVLPPPHVLLKIYKYVCLSQCHLFLTVSFAFPYRPHLGLTQVFTGQQQPRSQLCTRTRQQHQRVAVLVLVKVTAHSH